MKSQVSEISPVLVEVKVEVPWDTVKEDLDKHFPPHSPGRRNTWRWRNSVSFDRPQRQPVNGT